MTWFLSSVDSTRNQWGKNYLKVEEMLLGTSDVIWGRRKDTRTVGGKTDIGCVCQCKYHSESC